MYLTYQSFKSIFILDNFIHTPCTLFISTHSHPTNPGACTIMRPSFIRRKGYLSVPSILSSIYIGYLGFLIGSVKASVYLN